MAHGAQTDLVRLLLDGDYAQTAADAMQALAAPSRLRLLARLSAGPASVSDLAAAVGMESSAVSHQLRVMRHLGLVVGRRDGRHVMYALHDDHIVEMLEQVVSHVEHVRLGLANRVEPARAAGARR